MPGRLLRRRVDGNLRQTDLLPGGILHAVSSCVFPLRLAT
jgi:hypothetical protein